MLMDLVRCLDDVVDFVVLMGYFVWCFGLCDLGCYSFELESCWLLFMIV